MGDDLKLILTCLKNQDDLTKIVINIPGGFNDRFWSKNFLYFAEPNVFEEYKKLMPLHCQTFVKKILDIDEVFEIIT